MNCCEYGNVSLGSMKVWVQHVMFTILVLLRVNLVRFVTVNLVRFVTVNLVRFVTVNLVRFVTVNLVHFVTVNLVTNRDFLTNI